MYQVVGADQREYGPVTEERVRQWIKEGRANGATIVRFGSQPWKPLSTFPEFSSDLNQRPPPGAESRTFLTPLTHSDGAAPKTHPLAITGLVLSILGWVPCCCLTPLCSVAALGFSAIALIRINQQPEKWAGKHLATASVILALASLAIAAALHFWFGGGKFPFVP